MKNPVISRRKLLAGFATASGTGAVVGTGTSSLFSDTATFTGNNVEASSNVAGVVDIEVSVTGDPTSVTFGVSLPTDSNGENVNNNPSYVWFRSDECPSQDLDVNEVTVDGDPIVTGASLRDVLDGSVTTNDGGDISEGVLLSCAEDCLEPGERCDLVIDLASAPTTDCSFALVFYGEQCRYRTDPGNNPFSAEGPNTC
jgi:hypothetical protein